MSVTWVLEMGVLPRGEELAAEIGRQGHRVIRWSDDFRPIDAGAIMGPAIFMGSLNVGNKLKETHPHLVPGTFCDSFERFRPSRWTHLAPHNSLNGQFLKLHLSSLLSDTETVAKMLDVSADARVFIKPDSTLKEFSGRVVQLDKVTMHDLDFGIYYDDPDLCVIVSKCSEEKITGEFRFIVRDVPSFRCAVVAGSEYGPNVRRPQSIDIGHPVWSYIDDIVANKLGPIAPMYVVDVANLGGLEGNYAIVEVGPFGCCDLYACDLREVVRNASAAAVDSYGHAVLNETRRTSEA